MNINEEKQLRKAIQEILMSLPEFQEIIKKPNNKDVKKDAYDDVVDLKGQMEKDEIDTENVISQIEKTVKSLGVLKTSINNSLTS